MIHRYTHEMDAFIRERFHSMEYKEIAMEFSLAFDVVVTGTAIRRRCCKLGITGNKENSSRKCKAMHDKNSVPIGSERIIDGIVWVKVYDVKSVGNKKISGGYTSGGNWRKKAYINYEKAFGEIPDGKRLIYLDGDSTNCDPENLYFADVGVQMHVARHGYQDNGEKDLTLAAAKYYELVKALRDIE